MKGNYSPLRTLIPKFASKIMITADTCHSWYTGFGWLKRGTMRFVVRGLFSLGLLVANLSETLLANLKIAGPPKP